MLESDKLKAERPFLIKEIERLQKENLELRISKFKAFNNEECWIYQGDGSDHLESLTCPVVISATKLKSLGG